MGSGQRTRLKNIWYGIKNRCENKSSPSYKNYGGRGITLCKRWHDFDLFCLDMGQPPELYQIHRIDNDKGYCPENCIWMSPSEHTKHKSNLIYVTYKSKRLKLSEWSEILKIKPGTLRTRIFKYKWSVEKALETPINEQRQRAYRSKVAIKSGVI